MKFLKYSLYTLMAMAVSASFTACDSDDVLDGYTAGAPSDGPYFASTLAESYDVSAGEASVTFDVSRADAAGEATYQLEVKNPDAQIFTVPTEVKFAADATVAPVVISFDPAKVEDGDSYKFELTVVGASPYGVGSYTFTIMKPEPWKSLGMCLYTDDIVGSLYNTGVKTWEVELLQNEKNTNLYRLVNPYEGFAKFFSNVTFDDSQDYNIDFVIEDGKVYFTPNPFCLGVTVDPDYGVVYGGQPEDGIGTYEDGIITFPTKGLLTVEEGEYGKWYYANRNGNERIVFPGVEVSDYSAEINYAGLFIPADGAQQAIFNVDFGADVENARVAAAITTDVEALANSVVAGEIEFVEVTEPGEVRVATEGPGEYVAVIVTYGKGEPQLYAATEFEIVGSGNVDEGNWASLGQCDFIDGWFVVGLNLPNGPSDALNYPASVEIQKSDDTPGLYRLMAPFTNDTYLAAQANAIQKVRNIVINCQDPSYCFVEPQKSGWGNPAVQGGAELVICDGGYLYPTLGIAQPAQVVAAGLGSSLTVDADGVSTILINSPFFGKSADPDDLGYSFIGQGQEMIPSIIMFVEEDTPAAQAALKKKVIAKTIDMLSGKIVRPATKSLALTKSANSVKKYKSNKKANGAIL